MSSPEDIKYNEPIRVSRKLYNILIVKYAQQIAHRKDKNGRYWVKLWVMKYREELFKDLTANV